MDRGAAARRARKRAATARFGRRLQAPEISSKLSCCLHTAEDAGSIPASPTLKIPASVGKSAAFGYCADGFVQQPSSNLSALNLDLLRIM